MHGEINQSIYDPEDDCHYDQFVYTENGVEVKTLAQFWFEDLGFCGCGESKSVMDVIGGYLKALSLERVNVGYNDALFTKFSGVGASSPMGFLLQYLCDSKGLTEHGVSVSGSWLTEKGEMILASYLKWVENSHA